MNDLDAKAKIAVAELAYEMLWSAWREMLAGRYGSAISHWRSISEAPEILRALTVRPELAQVWLKNQLKIEKARRAVRDALKDQGHAAVALDWERQRTEDSKGIQNLAHLTVQTCVGGTPVQIDDDGNPVAFLVGGIPDERLTRLIGLYLAYEANLLLSSSVFAFQHLKPVEDFWNELGELDIAAGVTECVKIYDEPSMRLAMGRSETDD